MVKYILDAFMNNVIITIIKAYLSIKYFGRKIVILKLSLTGYILQLC